jgi:phosphomannomutase
MDVHAEAQRWIAADPDPVTRAELQGLVDAGDDAALAERFATRLEFGTAGIRGPLGAGPARMNRVLVRRVTAGLAARLLLEPGAADRGVIVGRDARHMSAEFAEDTTRVLAGAGIRVHVLPGVSPTPVVAFCVGHLGAAAGVQITASHNPPSDNGYKVYWGDGAQILPPLDQQIAAAIDAIEDVVLAPADDPLVQPLGGDVVEAYLAAALSLLRRPAAGRDLRIVTTALHGVGGDLAGRLLSLGGFDDVHPVADQAAPDPDFPTVAFPNPEVPGALDRALHLAADTSADLVLANDPDADRIAAAVVDHDGSWRPLDGDELGCLLAEWLLETRTPGPPAAVATTVVSSQLLARIAAYHRVTYRETLTGFKWLARAALDVAAEGGEMVLGYEQALGVMCGTAVLDKDGLSAALVTAEMAAVAKAEGRTLLDRLDDLARRHGVHVTVGRSLLLEGPGGAALVQATLERLLADPPRSVEGVPVVAVADHVAGVRRFADGRTEPLSTPAADLVGLQLEDGTRLQVRPSGTEPLLKFYAEVVEPVAGDVSETRQRARVRLERLADEWVRIAAG